MYQIKVNGILMPTIYWYLRDAMNACDIEKARGGGRCWICRLLCRLHGGSWWLMLVFV